MLRLDLMNGILILIRQQLRVMAYIKLAGDEKVEIRNQPHFKPNCLSCAKQEKHLRHDTIFSMRKDYED